MSHVQLFFDEFDKINQNAPWMSPFADIHRSFCLNEFGCRMPLYAWLNRYFDDRRITPIGCQNQPLSFTHQNDLEHGTAYETHIGKYHKIPTRDNLHDWFGACIWSIFPKTKALLNTKHLSYINQNDTANKRNRVRDTITVFDENGAILAVCDDEIGKEIGQALTAFDWQTCLIKNKSYWSDYQNHPETDKKAKVFVFGHALLEQLINPYKSLCSHTFVIKVPAKFFMLPTNGQLNFLDNKLSESLEDFLVEGVTPKSLNPLPILGVPHFWDNADTAFYDDPFVFRSGRSK